MKTHLSSWQYLSFVLLHPSSIIDVVELKNMLDAWFTKKLLFSGDYINWQLWEIEMYRNDHWNISWAVMIHLQKFICRIWRIVLLDSDQNYDIWIISKVSSLFPSVSGNSSNKQKKRGIITSVHTTGTNDDDIYVSVHWHNQPNIRWAILWRFPIL